MSDTSSIVANLPLGASLEIFTDGSCKGNPGPAGYGFVVVHDHATIYEASASIGRGTNVRAEMTGAVEALRLLQGRADLFITIVTDNEMVVLGMTKWLAGWKAKNWKGSKKPVANRDLWEQLDALAATLPHLTWRWVRGHDGNEFNELADKLATAAARNRKVA